MKVVGHQLFIAAALFAGVAIGYFLKPDPPHGEPTRTEAVRKRESAIVDQGSSATIAALKRRVAELEALLHQAEIVLSATNSVARQVDGDRHDRGPTPPSAKDMRERMERMAKENPARFAQITNRMARFRQHRLERANAKLGFLSSVDTSEMSDEQKKAHEDFQEMLYRREELMEKMHDPELQDSEREETMRKMHEMERELRRSSRSERELLVSRTASALGFSGEDAETFCTTIREIVGATENGPMMPPPGESGGQGPR